MKKKHTARISLKNLSLTGCIAVYIMSAGCRGSVRLPAAQRQVDSLPVLALATSAPVVAENQLPAILIAPGLLKPYTWRNEMIDLPDSTQRDKFRMLNGIKANVNWSGIVPLEEGDFECYTFSLINKKDTLFRIDSVFKVWLPEAGGDWVSIQLKKEVAETNSPGTVYLVNIVNGEALVVDQDIHNVTNAPIVKVEDVTYVFYVKDDKIYRYNIAEKKTSAIAKLKYKDIDGESIDPYKLEVMQTAPTPGFRLVLHYNGRYYFIPFSIG